MNKGQNKPLNKLPDNFIEQFNKHEQEIYKNADTTSVQPTKTLEIGDKIELFGGYYYDPIYLRNPPSSKRSGRVTKFIKGHNESDAAVVKLDCKIFGDSLSGDIIVLELRYVGQNWFTTGPVHIELCDFEPQNETLKERRKGEWLEAAASFKIIK